MKRGLSYLTILVLLLALIIPASANELNPALELDGDFELNTITVLNDFTQAPDGTGDWNPWDAKDGTESSHVDGKFKVDFVDQPDENPTAALADVQGTGDYLAIGFHISTTDDVTIQPVIDAGGTYHEGIVDAPVYLVADDDNITKINITDEQRTMIPASFEGAVIYPISSLADADLSDTDFGFNLKFVNPSAMTVVLDDLALYGYEEPEEVEPTEEPTAKPTEEPTQEPTEEPSPTPFAVPFSKPIVIENFTNYAAKLTSDFSTGFGAWGGDFTGDFASRFSIVDGMLRVSYISGNDETFTVDVASPSKGHQALSLYVDGSGLSEEFELRIILATETGYLQPSAGTLCYLEPVSGEVSELVIDDEEGNVLLPAGYKGRIVIPFASLTNGSITMDDIFALSGAVGFQVKVKTPLAEGTVILYDDFAYHKEAGVDAGTNPKTGDTSAIYFILALVAISGLITFTAVKRKTARQ
ncbi:MAG TPA: LPXTG cell wall anchor domain-containing protein [Bacillota bacterium]|nr:LPXTG cell wall anchor domain-containing protein [Bacillota bacterium]